MAPAAARLPRRGREVLLVAASAAVVFVASAWPKDRADAPAMPEVSAALPSPLPSGAPLRAPAPGEPEGGCAFADRGFGDYERWRPLPLGRALVPIGRGVDGDGGFNLLIHFHGAEPVRKVVAPEGYDLVVVGIDQGSLSSHYEQVAASADALGSIVASVEHEVARASGIVGARARRVALSSWSAGYGALSRILSRSHDHVSALVILDSLYASYAHGREPAAGQLAPWLAAARAAADGDKVFYLTHTEVPTEGYASTRETAAYLLREVGGERGGFFVRGYPGASREDHCAQLRLLPAILEAHVLPAFAR